MLRSEFIYALTQIKHTLLHGDTESPYVVMKADN